MLQPVGIARTEIDVMDLSTLASSGLKGIAAVAGVTEFGEPGQTYLIGSWLEYQRNLGGLLDSDDFPLLCKMMLDAGARLRITRVAHYTDIEDYTSIVGVKASGTITAAESTTTATARDIGTGGNKIMVEIVPAANGVAEEVDIRVVVQGFTGEADLTQVVKNVPMATTAESLETLNAQLNMISLAVGATNELAIGLTGLTGGAQDPEAITNTDYIGSSISNTGIHAFDNISDAVYIAVPAKAEPDIDIALANYVDSREGMLALIRTPVGVNGAGAVDYREGTGTYEHVAIDSWKTLMSFGGVKLNHPITGAKIEKTELADVIALNSVRDNKHKEWLSTAGPKRGRIKNRNGVVYNVGTNARRLEADNLVAHGINPVIEHPTFGVVLWGSSTLWKADTLLKHAEVAQLLVYLERDIKPIAESEQFDPNDVETWKAIYRKVKPRMEEVEANRGVWKWLYEGDQDIDTVEEAVVNKPSNIDLGVYIFRLWIAPKVAMKYTGIQVAVTNSGTSFTTI